MEPVRQSDPKTLGDFKIIARLGQGGMGTVFLATRGTQRVALKVVRNNFYDDTTLRTRFQREIDTLKKIRSPFVARFLDSSIEEDFAWHAVEFANGPNLKEQVDHNGQFLEDQWWTLADQLRSALAAIHALGIVHRDIKPSNIILTESGLKLIDFGISQDSEATSLTTTGMVAGSPAWLAPEQLEGTEISPASDLFSAGSVLVFAATGRSPWGRESSMSVPVVYQKILTAAPDLVGLSSGQAETVRKLLQSAPHERRFEVPHADHRSSEESPVITERHGGGQNRARGRSVLAGWVATALILIALPIVSFATWPVFDPSATAPQASIVTEDGQELSCAGAQRITAEITTEYLDPGKAGSLSQLQTISSKMAALEADDRILAASYGPELPWHFQTLHDAIRLALSLSNRGVIGASDQELSEALREGPVPYLIKQIEDVCKSS